MMWRVYQEVFLGENSKVQKAVCDTITCFYTVITASGVGTYYTHASAWDRALVGTRLLIHILPGGEIRYGGTVWISIKKERTRRKMTALETMPYI